MIFFVRVSCCHSVVLLIQSSFGYYVFTSVNGFQLLETDIGQCCHSVWFFFLLFLMLNPITLLFRRIIILVRSASLILNSHVKGGSGSYALITVNLDYFTLKRSSLKS